MDMSEVVAALAPYVDGPVGCRLRLELKSANLPAPRTGRTCRPDRALDLPVSGASHE